MADVIVVGGGIVGLLSARELALRGVSVTLLDAAPQFPSASWAGGGILSPLFPWRYGESITRLALPALSLYQSIAAEIVQAGGPDPEVATTGLRVLAPSDPEHAQAWSAEHGVACETRQTASGVDILLPQVGTVRNPALLKGLRGLLASLPAVELKQARVQALSGSDQGWAVRTEGGTLHARRVLVSAGSWSDALLQPLGIKLPVMPVKGEMLMFPPGAPQPDAVLLTEEGYLIPRLDGSMLVGSTVDEGNDSCLPTARAGSWLWQLAGELWPALRGMQPCAQWAGIRPGSRRESPFMGEAPGKPGLFVATGHYRNGLTCAPASARLMAGLMTGEPEPGSEDYSLPSC
jgi:glycine oxidase